MISARGLSRSFDGRPAVEELTFEVPEGSLCALLGPNGAGKTTTVRLLLGLLTPTAGGGEVAGVTLPASDPEGARLRGRCGLLTEAPGFYDRLDGLENLDLFGRLYGLDEAELRRRIEHWLRRFELWEARARPFGTWSKGMKQRLALIRAVLHQPPVLFLDEPTAGLDPAAAREVRDLVSALRAEGRTILLCTHNLAEAEELADLVGIMRRRMLVFGARAALTRGTPGLELEVAGDGGALAAGLRSLPAVRAVAANGRSLRVTLDDPERDTPAVVREAVRLGAAVLAVRPAAPSLEEIYLRAMREAP
ncbi:MAG TPA: ABC transporter ATP-binding protein [Gemmatimonadales bacterium]|jgi:ABC-2 type transport system ATP-binding protein|nr:ABC transporter ATP-binding protein [Gemmatimonadales bacterium]